MLGRISSKVRKNKCPDQCEYHQRQRGADANYCYEGDLWHEKRTVIALPVLICDNAICDETGLLLECLFCNFDGHFFFNLVAILTDE
jgi:hypothetical protein